MLCTIGHIVGVKGALEMTFHELWTKNNVYKNYSNSLLLNLSSTQIN